MTAPRVVLVTPPIQQSGGIGRLMSQFLDGCPPDARPVAILDPRGPGKRPWLSPLFLIRALLRLRWLMLRSRVDVAHINISVKASTRRKLMIARLASRHGLPIVLHLHAGNYPTWFSSLAPKPQARIRAAFASATTVVVLGEVWKTYAVDVLGVDPSRVAVLPNAASGPDRMRYLERTATEPLHIMFLSRLGEPKGVDTLLAALAQLPQGRWRATLAGDGDRERFRVAASNAGLSDSVSFPGWLNEPESRKLLEASHVHVLPSRAEGLPMSVLEAMAMGVTNVVTPVGAVREVIQDRVNGLLVPVGDADALADQFLSLINDETLRRRLADAARVDWEKRYSITAYVAALTSIWASTA